MIERFKWPLLLRVLALPHQGAELPGVAVLRVRKIPFRVFPSCSEFLAERRDFAQRILKPSDVAGARRHCAAHGASVHD